MRFNFLIYNTIILFSSLTPCFALLLERLPFLNNKRAFSLMILSLLVFEIYLCFFNNDFYGGINGYARLVLFIYPLLLILSNVVFTYRFGFDKFAKTLALSLLLVFLLTETHEIANYFYEYTGWNSVINHPLHPLTNIYSIVTGWLLFKKLQLNARITLALIGVISLSSFLYYEFAYTLAFSPWMRLIQFSIFMSVFYKWGRCEWMSFN